MASIALYKGLVVVYFPHSWVADPATVRFALGEKGRQMIDFRPNGGPVMEFWPEYRGPEVFQRWRRLDDAEAAAATWTGKPVHVVDRVEVGIFGQSGQAIYFRE
jgi:hypothetical protein